MRHHPHVARLAAVTVAAGLLLGGCQTTGGRNQGAVIGTAVGTTIGAIIGGRSGAGVIGGALIGGVAGLIVGAFVDELNEQERQAQAQTTQRALDAEEPVSYDWVSPDNPTRVHGRTEIIQHVSLPPGGGAPVVITPATHATPSGVSYCLPPDGKAYRLEAPSCPDTGNIVTITETHYRAMTAQNPDQPTAIAASQQPTIQQPVRTRTALECKTARQTVIIDGKTERQDVQYCRAPNSNSWQQASA